MSLRGVARGLAQGTTKQPRRQCTTARDGYEVAALSLTMTKYFYNEDHFAFITTVAACKPFAVAVKVISPGVSFACTMANARPLNALR